MTMWAIGCARTLLSKHLSTVFKSADAVGAYAAAPTIRSTMMKRHQAQHFWFFVVDEQHAIELRGCLGS